MSIIFTPTLLKLAKLEKCVFFIFTLITIVFDIITLVLTAFAIRTNKRKK